MRRAACLLVLPIVMALSLGCSRGGGEDPPCVCESEASAVVDPLLLAFLSQARAAHRDADLAELSGDHTRAITPLLGLTGSPLLREASPPPEAREVAADTLARIADLQSTLGDFASAEAAIERGLNFATEPTYFRGHLFEVRGVVLQRQAASQAAAGEEAAAGASRREAMVALEAAIQIQDEVIQQALSAPRGEPR